MRLGIDIGGTKINIGLFTDDGNMMRTSRLDVSVTNTQNRAQRIAEEAKKLMAKDMASCCGVGVPGTVSEDGKSILKAPNLGLPDDFCQALEANLGIPCTFVQDSRAAAWGEYRAGAGKDAKTLICLTLGTGIGTGIVMDGKIYNGALGAAGELGHIPNPGATEGRGCGCGKTECVEKYAAGGGLQITAKKLLGDSATATDLFQAASDGNTAAQAAIKDAVELLGNTVVGAINLLSPDCVLFSGGMAQQDAFLQDIIAYVKEHCYNTGTLPRLEKAALGEYAPLCGAAMIPTPRHKPQLAASVMCADFLHMADSLKALEEVGVAYVHCDIMDNHFVPNLMLPPEFCNKIRKGSNLPFDYHIMCERPESVVERLDIRPGDFVSIHYESTVHVQRMLALVKKLGARPAIAINPATPLEVLTDILPDIGMVLIMSVNPGFAAQPLVPSALAKIARLRQMLDNAGRNDVIIEVDGNCSFVNMPNMYRAGGDLFVVGSSSLFSKDMTIKEAAEKIAQGFDA